MLTYIGYSYDSPLSDIPITLENGYPKLQPPCTTEPVKKRLPDFIKDLKWLVICVQTIFLVTMLLIIFVYFLYRPQRKEIEFKLNDTSGKTLEYLNRNINAEANETGLSQLLRLAVQREEKSVNNIKLSKAGVYSDNAECSRLGSSVLMRGCNAVDASIVTAICISAVLPHKAGLGGGLMATIVKDGVCNTVNARETAGMGAQASNFSRRPDEAVVGPKAIAIPGYLSGLFRLYQEYGSKKISWKDLLKPVVELCRNGIRVSKELAHELVQHRKMILNDHLLRDVFVNTTSQLILAEDDVMFCHNLASTLADISEYEDAVDYFYKGGNIGQELLNEIREKGGSLSSEDLEDYVTESKKGLSSMVAKDTIICGPHPPSVFINVQLAIRSALADSSHVNEIIPLLAKDSQAIGDLVFSPSLKDLSTSLSNVGAIQSVLSRVRSGERSAKNDEIEDGSSAILIIDQHGMAISLMSSLGSKFGSQVYSRLGFFLNNAMSFFNFRKIPNHERHANTLQPGKTPRSLLSPIIGLKSNKVFFLTGGSNFTSVVHTTCAILRPKKYTTLSAPLLSLSQRSIKLAFGSAENFSGY